MKVLHMGSFSSRFLLPLLVTFLVGVVLVPKTAAGQDICNICGDGYEVSMPNAIVSIPTQPDRTCQTLVDASLAGNITQANCALLQPFVSMACGCLQISAEEEVSGAPTPAVMVGESTPSPTTSATSSSTSSSSSMPVAAEQQLPTAAPLQDTELPTTGAPSSVEGDVTPTASPLTNDGLPTMVPTPASAATAGSVGWILLVSSLLVPVVLHMTMM